jgi:hypothetical protein
VQFMARRDLRLCLPFERESMLGLERNDSSRKSSELTPMHANRPIGEASGLPLTP